MKNHAQNLVEVLFPDPFLKIKIEHISGTKHFLQFVFIVCQVEDYRNMLKPSCRPFAFISNKAFLNILLSDQI